MRGVHHYVHSVYNMYVLFTAFCVHMPSVTAAIAEYGNELYFRHPFHVSTASSSTDSHVAFTAHVEPMAHTYLYHYDCYAFTGNHTYVQCIVVTVRDAGTQAEGISFLVRSVQTCQ